MEKHNYTLVYIIAVFLGTTAFRIFNNTDGQLVINYKSATHKEISCIIPERAKRVSSCIFKDKNMDADTLLDADSEIYVTRIQAGRPDKRGVYRKCRRSAGGPGECMLNNLYVNEDPNLSELLITNVPAQP